jgi:hypothetical protein
MSFEHHKRPLLPRNEYVKRVLRFAGFSLILLGISLGIGVVGYHYLNHLTWLDSLLNASMILTGMGPVDPVQSDAAKWFASFYAIFSGVAFLSTVTIFFSPIVHRFLHRLHVDEEQKGAD